MFWILAEQLCHCLRLIIRTDYPSLLCSEEFQQKPEPIFDELAVKGTLLDG
jgi:hypothetical protein